MLEVINQNPGLSAVVAIILGLIALGTTQWKILSTLFIKPRDEELVRLRRRVDELAQQERLKHDFEAPTFDSSTKVFSKTDKTNDAVDEDPFKSLQAFGAMMNKEDVTELQRQAILNETIGVEVTWSGEVSSVLENRDNKIVVFITGGSSYEARAMCEFEASYKGRLSKLRKGHKVTVRGKITDMSLSPQLGDCELLFSEAD